MPEHVDRDALDAGAHRHHAEIGRLGNQSGHQRFIEMRRLGLMALDRCEVAAKASELINLHQQLLDPDEGQAGIDDLLQGGHRGR